MRAWVNADRRAPKTIANHHGLLFALFAWGVDKGLVADNPCRGTKLPRQDTSIEVDDKVFLTEAEFAVLRQGVHADSRDLVTVAAGTGLRYGELAGLWAGDIDLGKRTLRVQRAWKREGEDGERPSGVRMLAKHEVMRDHYLGAPKTRRSRRTISLSPSIVAVLAGRCCAG